MKTHRIRFKTKDETKILVYSKNDDINTPFRHTETYFTADWSERFCWYEEDEAHQTQTEDTFEIDTTNLDMVKSMSEILGPKRLIDTMFFASKKVERSKSHRLTDPMLQHLIERIRHAKSSPGAVKIYLPEPGCHVNELFTADL